jgi:hypothetical protein
MNTYKVSKVVLCQIIASKVNSFQFCRFHAIHHCSKFIISVDANTVRNNNRCYKMPEECYKVTISTCINNQRFRQLIQGGAYPYRTRASVALESYLYLNSVMFIRPTCRMKCQKKGNICSTIVYWQNKNNYKACLMQVLGRAFRPHYCSKC